MNFKIYNYDKKIATRTEYTEKIETKIRKNNVISYTY